MDLFLVFKQFTQVVLWDFHIHCDSCPHSSQGYSPILGHQTNTIWLIMDQSTYKWDAVYIHHEQENERMTPDKL